MNKNRRIWLSHCRRLDWAVLYMRLFAGAAMLFHNIGKIQDYNEIIDTYPSFLFLGNVPSFFAVAAYEVLFSVLIILGIRVRLSALALALGIVLLLLWQGLDADGSLYLWLGIYLFFLISGGGLYAFDRINIPSDGTN